MRGYEYVAVAVGAAGCFGQIYLYDISLIVIAKVGSW
jgi:hypothetical protein